MSDVNVEVNCPKCSWKILIKVKDWIPGRTKICPQCKVNIRFSVDDGRKVQRELAKFERKLKTLNR